MISIIYSYQKNSDSVNPGLSSFQRKELKEAFGKQRISRKSMVRRRILDRDKSQWLSRITIKKTEKRSELKETFQQSWTNKFSTQAKLWGDFNSNAPLQPRNIWLKPWLTISNLKLLISLGFNNKVSEIIENLHGSRQKELCSKQCKRQFPEQTFLKITICRLRTSWRFWASCDKKKWVWRSR